MMPVKEILEKRPILPERPILVVDETTIKNTVDTGPYCECTEKHQTIKNYKPFIPGGVHPYSRRKIPDKDCLEIVWRNIRVGSFDLIFEKPVAIHQNELPANYVKEETDESDLMFIQPPIYTEEYFNNRLKNPNRGHITACNCS